MLAKIKMGDDDANERGDDDDDDKDDDDDVADDASIRSAACLQDRRCKLGIGGLRRWPCGASAAEELCPTSRLLTIRYTLNPSLRPRILSPPNMQLR